MTSSRQREANRLNARRSTGPRTAAGKAASRMNARWHGLARPLRWEPGIDEEIERLAIAIAGARSDLMDLARPIAEAELELRRVRQARILHAKLAPLTGISEQPEFRNHKSFMGAVPQATSRYNSDPDCGEAYWDLGAFNRYEQRALSRRKFAIRDFDRARLEPPQEGN
jgi:hypothetical protein